MGLRPGVCGGGQILGCCSGIRDQSPSLVYGRRTGCQRTPTMSFDSASLHKGPVPKDKAFTLGYSGPLGGSLLLAKNQTPDVLLPTFPRTRFQPQTQGVSHKCPPAYLKE